MRLEHLLSGVRDACSGFMLESWFVRVLHAACLSSALCSGGLAQLARAPALQAGGQRFESVILHEFVRKRIDEVNPVPDTVGVLRRIAFFDILRQKRHKIRISVTPSCCHSSVFPMFGRRMVSSELCEKRVRAHGGCLGSRRR